MDREAKILKFPAHDRPDSSEEDERMGARTPRSATALAPAPPASQLPPPVWMQRFFLIATVIFCLWVGMVLSVLPWLTAWTENALVSDFPGLRWFLGTGFIRGLATGLGLLDLWIGISEAVHYRDRR